MTHSVDKAPNRLIHEKSPYLLQHANNPVDWYPWCDEAFVRAKAEDKPIFLSIGYSCCHWCHVMEEESFEDSEVAELLNKNFISIKVDREERPDVDTVYMDVCQSLTGSGGWPLTIVMTPEQKPFYAATYLPKNDRYGHIGLLGLLGQIRKKWETERDRILHSAEEITSYINQQYQQNDRKNNPNEKLLETGIKQLTENFDHLHGGFGGAPKFPVPHNLIFLMKMYEDKKDSSIMEMVEKTLIQMYRGGIFDHIGGGFSRYSTDDYWLVPHFEKMLYDNALLVLAYLDAYRITDTPLYLHIAERTLKYIEVELTHTKGGFYCSQDADSDGEEGKYYVFTPGEVTKELGKPAGDVFCQWLDIDKKGNFMEKSIPNLLKNEKYDQPPAEMESLCEILYVYRMQRNVLHKDDKILASWNGLGILAFTKAWLVTGKTGYIKKARKAASFVRANLQTLNGKMKVRWRDGDAANDGQLMDYACYGLALMELYQADFNISWLRTALNLGREMLNWFEDREKGGFFVYGSHAVPLISRPKEIYDGAMPSGNSMAAMFLIRLAKLTGEGFWQEAVERQMEFLSGACGEYPAGHTVALLAIHEYLHDGIHLVCVSSEKMPVEELRQYRTKQEGSVDALIVTADNQKSLGRLLPFVKEYEIPKDGIQYYICKNGTCQPPKDDLL